jgi:hypothetical protein
MGICPELIIFCCFLMGSYRELFRRAQQGQVAPAQNLSINKGV